MEIKIIFMIMLLLIIVLPVLQGVPEERQVQGALQGRGGGGSGAAAPLYPKSI